MRNKIIIMTAKNDKKKQPFVVSVCVCVYAVLECKEIKME